MGLFDRKPDSTVPPLTRSGMVPTSRAGTASIHKLWNDGEDDKETTGDTNHVPASGRARVNPHLMVMTGLAAGRLIAIDTNITIGRSRSCDLRVEDNGVSRTHCRISRQGQKILIEDLGSRNGTIVNGIKVLRAELSAGDRVQLGPDLVLQLSMYDDAEETLARKLFDASTRDPLTRAFNRHYFAQRLDAEMSHARRHESDLSVMMMNVDGMRAINESHGHAAGDDVLRAIVEAVGNIVRAEDLFCRYGGDEIAFVLREPLRSATRTAERVRLKIEALRVTAGRKPVQVTASIGVAEIGEPGAQLTGEGLVMVAEKRLRRAKLLGKNRVVSD